MRKEINLLFISLLTILSGAGNNFLSAQAYTAPAIEVSKEKVKIDGKIFLSHVVKEKQTLYSISKAYGTSIDELYKYNPKLKEEGLKKNSILLIPVTADTKESTEKSAAKPLITATKETEQNRTGEKHVRKRQEKKDLENKKIHVVRWYEDIKSIARKHGVTVEDIMMANNLVDTRLTTRQKLVIPEKSHKIQEKNGTGKQDIEVTEATDTVLTATTETTVPDKRKKKRSLKSIFFFPKSNINMTLFLPFQAQNGKSSRNNMDFYSGALLAIKHLSEDGINTNLSVYDTYAAGFVAEREMIEKSDIIIGPMTSEQITKISAINSKAIPLVSPLDPKTEKLTEVYPNIIFAPSAHRRQYEDLCKWVSEDFVPENKVIVIAEKDVASTNYDHLVSTGLEQRGIPYECFKYSILEGRDITQSLSARLAAKGTSRIVIASESEAFVNDIVRNINLLMLKNKDIVLYAGSKIRSFETIAPEYLHNAKLHVSMSYNIDYQSADVRKFLMEYRALYNTEPSQFAYQGYDVTKYFIQMYSQYGNWWLDYLGDSTTPMLQSSFLFEKTAGGDGYVNIGVRRAVYESDFQIREIVR